MDDKQLEVIEICEAEFKNWNLVTIHDPETSEAVRRVSDNLKAAWKEYCKGIEKVIHALAMHSSKCPYGGHPVKGSTKPTFINKPHHCKRRR